MEGAAQIVRSSLESLDKEITLLINSWNTPFTDKIWIFFSNKLVWAGLYAVVLFFLFRRLGWKKALAAVLCLVLATVCCDQFANLIKNWACRLRPSHDSWMLAHGLNLPQGTGGKYGFFSAHAANCFSFALCSLLIFKEDVKHSYSLYGAMMMAWAFLVSLSRIFLGRHFLGDIVVGAAAGLLIGYLFAVLFRKAAGRF